ncbi:MAG: hypothetical protein ABSD48_03995 [Armatimonadota bacterium]|jgi:hypothetical protein
MPSAKTPAVLSQYTAADHRRRLENIGVCERGIRSCMRRHLVTSYLPGQCVYGLKGSNLEPSEEDDRALARMAKQGIRLVQIWSRWWRNCWGGDPMYQAANPEGLRRFIDLVHSHGLKIIPYTSTNFFERTDPNFRPAWATHQEYDLVESDYHLAHCSPASPGWRAHVLAATIRVLDDYGFDGLYNDMGYHRPSDIVRWGKYYLQQPKVAEDEVLAFAEGPTCDGAAADMLALIYAEVKRRGGIYKLHKEGVDRIHTGLEVYDYLWVGEAVTDVEFLRRTTKNYEPYVIPEFSRNFRLKSEDELYLNSIPYLQFPVSRTAQTGGTLEDQRLHAAWLKQYLPMVEEGTWAWLDIGDSDLFLAPLPKDVVVSAFANRGLYLVLANFGLAPVEIVTRDEYVPVLRPAAQPAKRTIWKLPRRSLQIVRKAV